MPTSNYWTKRIEKLRAGFAKLAARRRTRLRKILWALFVLFAIVVLLRNHIASKAIVFAAAHFADAEVTIGRINIGLFKITVEGLEVADNGDFDTPLVAVERTVIAPSILQGLKNGVWLRSVHVQSPTLQVHFDQDGKLTTVFPLPESQSESNSNSVLPLASLVVENAQVVVHQTGKESFRVQDISLNVTASAWIDANLNIPSLLGSGFKVQSTLDSKTYQGVSRLSWKDILLDSRELAKLPLVPESIAAEHLASKVNIRLQAEHPANNFDLRFHDVILAVEMGSLTYRGQRGLLESFALKVTNKQGKVSISSVLHPLDGIVQIKADADLNQRPIRSDLNLLATGVELGKLPAILGVEIKTGCKLDSELNFAAQFQEGNFTFSSTGKSTLAEITFDGIPIEDVHSQFDAVGVFSLPENRFRSGTVSAATNSAGLNLATVAKRYNIPATGQTSLSFRCTLPLASDNIANAAKASAYVHFHEVGCSGLQLVDNRLALNLQNGRLNLDLPVSVLDDQQQTVLKAHFGAATSTDPNDRLRLVAAIEQLSPQIAIPFLQLNESPEVGGMLQMSATASVDKQFVSDPAAWEMRADISGQDLSFQGETLKDFSLSGRLADGRLEIPETQLLWRDLVCRFSADGIVDNHPQIRGKVAVSPVLLRDIASVINRFSSSELRLNGRARVDGQFRVDLIPLDFCATGTANLESAVVSSTHIGDASLSWEIDREGLILDSGSRKFLGGSYQLSAEVAELDWTKTQLRGRVDGIQVARLLSFAKLDVPATGVVNAGFEVKSLSSLSALDMQGQVTSRGVRVRNIPITIANAEVFVRDGQLVAKGAGKICDGQFLMDARGGVVPLVDFFQAEPQQLEKIPISFETQLSDLPIEQVLACLGVGHRELPLSGLVHVRASRDKQTFEHNQICTVSASSENLVYSRHRLSDRITADVAVRQDQIELQNIVGRFAEGQLGGKAIVDLRSGLNGSFQFNARNVNLRRAASPFVPGVAGSASLEVSGRLASTISGRANLVMDNVVASGVSVGKVRLPIDWSYSARSSLARWQCRAGRAEVGGGTVFIASEGDFTNSVSMKTRIRFEGIDSAKVMRGKSTGLGMIDGYLVVNGRRASGPKDFSGEFDLSLTQIKALEIPVLDQLPQMIQLPQIGATQPQQDGGYLYGRFDEGVVRLEQLAIWQSSVQVLAEGLATFDGRLDLNVTASTQQTGPADKILEFANSPILLAAPAPVALIAKANDALKDRVVHVHVGGAAANPIMQLQPGKQLTQSAIQFFLKNSLGSQVANAASSRPQTRQR